MRNEKKKRKKLVSQQWNIGRKLEQRKLENNQLQIIFDVIRLV